MKAAIIQSNYLPWKGYFDIINEVDIFVFLEDVQYTTRDWRNRNRIKTAGGINWLSVPVIGGVNQKICETKIDYTQEWIEKHKKMIHHSYARAEYYHSYKDEIFEIYDIKYDTLSELNICAITKLSKLLGIETSFVNSNDLNAGGQKDDKLIEICYSLDVDSYLSGPSAQNYIIDEKFERNNIALQYKDYSGYPEYPQLWGDFNHFVSVIDVIFNCGEKAPYYIWNCR